MQNDLRARIEQILADQADDILAMIETAIRADERAKVIAKATSDAAVMRAMDKWFGPRLPHRNQVDRDDMRAAILAALEEAE